jgi:uncharacterized protein (TIGR03086 family)
MTTTTPTTTTGPDVAGLHARAAAAFDAVVQQIGPAQWSLPTPCADWDVRALVNHLVGEARWTLPLLAGLSPADVGTELDGDLLGSDPAAAWAQARAAADEAVAAHGVADRTVHLSYGDVPGHEYLSQLAADHLLHAWDLAVAIDADDRLDAGLVEAVGAWFGANEEGYRSAGAVGPRPPVEADDDPQTRLLAAFGRTARPAALSAVLRFGTAFDRQDVDAVMAAMTQDCVFEDTAPPDGRRYEGQEQVRDAWTAFFAASQTATFRTEERFVCGDRVVVRWTYTWSADGHIRGVDVFRTRDGLVAEKLSYVKG